MLQKSNTSDRSFLYKKGDWRLLQTGNSGTTFFSPLFDTFMHGHHEPLLIITDGEIYDLHRLHRYPNTLWVITENQNKSFEPPFGKVVTIKNTSNKNMGSHGNG